METMNQTAKEKNLDLINSILQLSKDHFSSTQIEEVNIRLKGGIRIDLRIPEVCQPAQPMYETHLDNGNGTVDQSRHSPDYRSVFWHGESFTFSATQASILKLLWEGWESNLPEVSGEYLLEKVDSQSNYVGDLFKGHPAWKKVIGPGKQKGCFSLLN